MTIKTDGHHWKGPAKAAAELPSFGAGEFDRVPQLVRATDGKPVEGMQFVVEREGESPLTGVSDGEGKGAPVLADRLQMIRAVFYKTVKKGAP